MRKQQSGQPKAKQQELVSLLNIIQIFCGDRRRRHLKNPAKLSIFKILFYELNIPARHVRRVVGAFGLMAHA